MTTLTFNYAVTGSRVTPATGSPIVQTNSVYSPITDAIPSVSMYVYIDNVFHRVTGALGSVEFNVEVSQLPVMRFSFQGLYNAVTDATPPASPDFSSFQIPRITNTQNTTNFSLLGYSGLLQSVNLNMSNDVQYRTLVGSEYVLITNRAPSGAMVVEAPNIAAKDFFSDARNGVTGAMQITQGVDAGNRVRINCPRVSLGNPSYQESQGIQMLSLPFNAAPNTGNDEVVITVS